MYVCGTVLLKFEWFKYKFNVFYNCKLDLRFWNYQYSNELDAHKTLGLTNVQIFPAKSYSKLVYMATILKKNHPLCILSFELNTSYEYCRF